MGTCSIRASLKQRRDKSEGIERGVSLKTLFSWIISIIKTHKCFIFILFVDSVIKEIQAHRNQQLVE